MTETVSHSDDYLEKFKQSLLALCKENLSQDSEFLKEISENWNHLLEESKKSSATKFPIELINTLKKEFSAYPENQEYTLCYYLAEYAGLQWSPFPYMDILQDLHFQYQKDPVSSLLKKWITLIEEHQKHEI